MKPLRSEHFTFFELPAEDRDAGLREEIRELLIDLWAAVRERLPENRRNLLGEIYAGPIRATQGGAWAQTSREQGEDLVNLTIEISSQQVDINAVGGTKPQAALLEAWLRGSEARNFWRENPDFELSFYLRSARTKGARPVWRGASWDLIRSYPAAEVALSGFSSLRIGHERETDGGTTEHLAYHLCRKWGKDEVVGTPEEWLDDLTRCAKILMPVVAQANDSRVW